MENIIDTMEELEKIVNTDNELSQAITYIKSGVKNQNIDPNWNIFYYLVNCCPYSWEELFIDSLDIIRNIGNRIEKNNHYPYFWEVFNAFHYCRSDNIKVVIIGQDPYPTVDKLNKPYACGLSFSVHPDNCNIPSSLQNVFKELKRSIPGYSNYNGDLSYWSKQGVFLFNTTLTVIPNDKTMKHKGIWNGFTEKTIEFICNKNKGCIFLLWGRKAEEYEKLIKNGCKVFKTGHPSGFSAIKYGFIGCNHFVDTNNILISEGKAPIDWNIPFQN